MMVNKRAKALMLSFIMLFSIIFSALVIIVDCNHDCSVEDCQICQTIQLCLEKFRGLERDENNVVLSAFSLLFFIILVFTLVQNDNFSTLVSQKVKLSI